MYFVNCFKNNDCSTSVLHFVFLFQLILFNDTEDSGMLDNSTKAWIVVPMTDFTWEAVNNSRDSVYEAGIVLETIEFRGQPLSNETKIHIEVNRSPE